MSLNEPDLMWTLLVPVKDSRAAKSRLGLPPVLTAELARALARDTVAKLCITRGVTSVVVVCDRPDDVTEVARWPLVRVWVDSDARGLNGALAAAADMVRGERPDASVAVCPADVPALDVQELATVLDLCAQRPRCVVGDHGGSGTTLLTARRGVDLDPRFGPDSFAAHRGSGAAQVDLPATAALRHDIDLPSDLEWLRRVAPRSRSVEVLSEMTVPS